jgi:hypothetical protein
MLALAETLFFFWDPLWARPGLYKRPFLTIKSVIFPVLVSRSVLFVCKFVLHSIWGYKKFLYIWNCSFLLSFRSFLQFRVGTFVKQLSKIIKKNPELFPDFWGIFEQNWNFSLFHQNLIKLFFLKNSKRTWLRKVWTNKKWLETLISKHPCGLQAKNPDFHVSTMKSRNNQIWIFLFEGFNLAHSSRQNSQTWSTATNFVPAQFTSYCVNLRKKLFSIVILEVENRYFHV